MSKKRTSREPRIKYETIYRVRWAAGSVDEPSLERAEEKAQRLLHVGVATNINKFQRPQ